MLRAQVALVLYLAVLATTFGVRMVIQRRRYGDSGWRFHRAAGAGALAQGLLVVAGVLVGVAAVAALVAGAAHEPLGPGWLTRADTTAGRISAGAGAALVVAGTMLTWVAQRQMGASWRVGLDAGERTALVTGGLFRQVRNPIFTGMALCLVGEALLVPNLLALGALVTGAIGLEVQVRRVEEPYLRATHGPDYLTWAATSGRFLPGLGHLHPDDRNP